MSQTVESLLKGLRNQRLLCLRELELHFSRGDRDKSGVQSCLEQIERINAEMLRLAADDVDHPDPGMGQTSGM